jgi:hypothetical protein
MPTMRSVAIALLGGVLLGWLMRPLSDPHVHAQQPARELPPVSYICPMAGDEDVLEDKPGLCPKCRMDLVPARIDTGYSCPNHPAIIRDDPGLCPLDRRELVRVVVTLHWACAATPGQRFMEPGTCANGSARTVVRELRAHADHNPRFGGQFFMAADNWHHLEGTYPRAGLFRVHMYDNFTKPMAVKSMSGRAVLREEFDSATRTYRELEAYPLRPGSDGFTLEAAIRNDRLPLTVTAKIKFDDRTAEQRFDFTFPAYSVVPPSAPVTTGAAPPATTVARASAPTPAPPPTPAPRPAAPAPAVAPPPAPAPPPTAQGGMTAPMPPPVAETMPTRDASYALPPITNCEPNLSRTDALLMSDALPKTAKELVGLLDMCRTEIQKLIDGGQFGYIYQPTMLGKDIAVALDGMVNELPARQRVTATDAVRRVVLAAWHLDYYADLGNRPKLTEAFSVMSSAMADVTTAYGAQR